MMRGYVAVRVRLMGPCGFGGLWVVGLGKVIGVVGNWGGDVSGREGGVVDGSDRIGRVCGISG